MKHYLAIYTDGKSFTFWAMTLRAAWTYAEKFGVPQDVDVTNLPDYQPYWRIVA